MKKPQKERREEEDKVEYRLGEAFCRVMTRSRCLSKPQKIRVGRG
jgi:hypothetical protein